MGCCSGRPTNGVQEQGESFRSIRKSYSSAKMAYLSNFSSKAIDDPEVEALKKAKDSKNIVYLLSKLDSDRLLAEQMEINHAWAGNATTIGAIACTYLLLSFIKESENEAEIEEMTQTCISEGIIYKVKRNFLSGFQDKIEISMLMTLFILEDNETFKEYLVQNKFSKEIYVYLDKTSPFQFQNKSGMRIATLQILRTCFAGNYELCKAFLEREHENRNINELLRDMDDFIVLECLYAVDELISVRVVSNKRDHVIMNKIVASNILADLDFVISRCERELKEHWVIKDLDTYEIKKNTLTYSRYLRKEILAYKKTEEMVKAIIN